MLDALYRPIIQRNFVDRLAIFLANHHISANLVTLLAMVVGTLSALCLSQSWSWLALGLLWGSGYLDMVDGSVARLRGMSHVGTIMDVLSDRVVEAAIIIGLFGVAPQSRGFACLLMLASVLICVTSFLVVGLFSENESNKSFHYSPGLVERAEAFILFSLMMVMPAYFDLFSYSFIFLVLLTTLIRVWEFKRAYV